MARYTFICSRCENGEDQEPRSFTGSKKKARELGWTDTEYGELCPECSAAQVAQDKADEEAGAQSGVGDLLSNIIATNVVVQENKCTPEELNALRDLVIATASLRVNVTGLDEEQIEEVKREIKQRFDAANTTENVGRAMMCVKKLYAIIGAEF